MVGFEACWKRWSAQLATVALCAGLLNAAALPARVEWVGTGGWRMLVEVAPVDLAGRGHDQLPTEIEIDFLSELKKLGETRLPDLASLQVMKVEPLCGDPLPFKDFAYGRSPHDRPFRWYDASVPYEFPEFMGSINHTAGEIRMRNRTRGGHFYNVVGDWRQGRLAWVHDQQGNQPSYYAIYFSLLPQGQSPSESAPAGWVGDGTPRREPRGKTTTGASHVCIDIDDWNGDGLLDLVFGEDYGHFFWFPNAGTRKSPRFPGYQLIVDAAGIPPDTGFAFVPLIIDWDGDGKKDVLAGSHWNRVVFFRNEGTNRARKLVYKGFVEVEGKPMALPFSPLVVGSEDIFKEDYYPVLASADWDGDGDGDLLAGGYVTGRIYFYENVGRNPNGVPRLRLAGPLEADGKPLNVGEWCASPCAADFDGDGDLDLVSGRFKWKVPDPEHYLRYYENVGTKRQAVLKERPFPKQGTFPAHNLAVPRAADWDSDGDLDLAVAAAGNIYLYRNLGDRRRPLFEAHDRPLSSTWGNVELPGTGAYISTQFIDWNRDGRLDVVSNYEAYLDQGKGNPGVYGEKVDVLPPGVRIAHPSNTGDDWFWPRLYDLDGDGRLDVLFGDWGGHVWFHRNLSTSGERRFDLDGFKLKTVDGNEIKVGPIGKDPKKDFAALQGARTVFTAADFNQDGMLDLAVSDEHGEVRYYENAGPEDNPLFCRGVVVARTGSRGMVDAVDWNRDGLIDLLVGIASSPVRLFLNQGTRHEPAFDKGIDLQLPPIIEPRAITVDLNQDGDEDLFIPSTLGSCFLERSFIEHGYAPARVVRIEKRGASPRNHQKGKESQ
ncbi:MAG: FG-GAP repeat domain-containing protein [Acidobacteriota bacterium]